MSGEMREQLFQDRFSLRDHAINENGLDVRLGPSAPGSVNWAGQMKSDLMSPETRQQLFQDRFSLPVEWEPNKSS